MATNTDEREEIKPVAPTEQTKWRDPSLVGKYMVDPKTGLAGLFRSPDNGETWVLTDTVYGHVYNQDEVDNIWDNGAGHKVADEVKSATADLPNVRKQADEAVKFAESAIAASKVNSDAIVAQSSAVVEAKSAMDSATAEIQQLKANAASDVAQIESTIAEVQTSINQAKSANESAVQAVQAELKSTSDAMDKVEKQLNEVGTSLDTYAKSAAEQGHDITVIKQKQGQFEADFASVQGNVNQIQADIKGLRQNIKDNQGNIATLLTSADKLQASMKDAQNNISNLLLTASEYEQTFKDQDGRLSKVEQTATEHTSELADAKGNIDKVTQKANTLQLLLSDAQKNIQNIQLDAKGLHDTLTGQSNQLASLNVTLNNLDSKYSGITGDLQSKQTALSTEQQQTKDMLLNKADKSEVDNVKGTVNQVSAEQKTMADQINQKVSSVEYQTLKDKVNGMKIGTRNLLHHSDTFEGWHRGSTVSIAGSKYLNGTVAILAPGGSGGNALNADLDGPYDNQPISWTVYAKADNTGDKLHTELWGGGGLTEQPLTTEWQVYKFTGQRDARKHSFLLWGCVGNKGNIYVALPFAVVGNYIGTWLANPTDTITSINKNSTAIDENNKQISLKADQTEVDKIKNTATQNSSRLDVMAGQISSKVTSTDVNNIVDSKGYTTQSAVQSIVDQKADTISETITSLDKKVGDNADATDKKIQEITASVDGVQSTVKKKADQSAVTQLANTYQIKLTGNLLASLGKKAQKYTVGNNTFFPFASIDVTKVTKGTVLTLSFDYSSDADCAFVPQLDGTPWIPWGDIKDNPISVKANVPGHYVKQITVGDDSWTKGTAKNIAIRIDNFGGTFTVSNLTLRSGDNVASTFDMLQYDMDLRVQKGDLISQLNLEAGRTLIQSQKIYMDADSVIMGPNTRAFIPSAAIVSLDADKITTGVLNGIDIHQIATKEGRSIDISGGNITLDSWDPYAPRLSFKYQGQMVKMFNASGDLEADTWGIFNFSPSDTQSLHPIQFFRVNNVGGKGSGSARMQLDHAIFDGHEWWANFDGITFGRSYDGINGSNDYVDLYAKSFLPHSQLSSKTRIEKLDGEDAMNTIKQVQMYTYQFKDDVRDGKTKRYASLIIDDVHDVAQYTEPDIFVADNKKCRDDGTQLAYAIAAIQYQQHEIEELKVQLKEKKANE
ncbi:tail fiber domain-containing protein [Limosilactobacillus reuteri]|uniref:tail fiber domain-containing protein n=1 Tax=Limosilactobacillus reuteri TaxID=1598 RepID=UPI003D085F84